MVSDVVLRVVIQFLAFIGTLLFTAVGAFLANFAWDQYKTPRLSVDSEASLVPVVGPSNDHYRYRVDVKNEGLSTASGCTASLSLLGENNKNNTLIVVRHLVGWIENIDRTHFGETAYLDSERDIGRDRVETLDLGRTHFANEQKGWQFQPQDRTSSATTIFSVDLNDAEETFVEQIFDGDFIIEDNIMGVKGCERMGEISKEQLETVEWIRSNLTIEVDNSPTQEWNADIRLSEGEDCPKIHFTPADR